MNEKVINDIVWWIPFKKLRNSVRELLYLLNRLNQLDRLENKIDDINNFLCKVNNNNIIPTKEILLKKFSNENIIYPVNLLGENYYFYDTLTSRAVGFITREINGYEYNSLFNLDFKEGDVVIDIGANIGMISILLAKKFPFIKIYAFEPLKTNYNNLLKNIELNKIKEGIIYPHNKAVTKDESNIIMNVNLLNPGGSYIQSMASNDYNNFEYYNEEVNIESITLEKILKDNDIKNIKLLKIDCEGSEYDILYNTNNKILSNIENLYGEFHLMGGKYNPDDLIKYIKQFIPNVNVTKLLE